LTLYLKLFGRFKYRGLILLGLGWYFSQSYYLPLLIGVGMADIYVNIKRIKLPIFLVYLGLGISLGLCSYPNQFTSDKLAGTIYALLPILKFTYTPTFYHVFGATGLIGCLFALPRLQKVFEKPIPQFLGRISYPLFIFHAVILAGISTPLFVGFSLILPYNLSAVLMLIPALYLIIVSAWAYQKYIEPKVR